MFKGLQIVLGTIYRRSYPKFNPGYSTGNYGRRNEFEPKSAEVARHRLCMGHCDGTKKFRNKY